MNNRYPLDLHQLNPFVRKAGYEKKNDWKNKKRKIYDHELIFCTDGVGTVIIQSKKYPIKAGSLFLIKPNIEHCLDIQDTKNNSIYWVHFDFTYRRDVIQLNQLVTQENSVLFSPVLPKKNLIRNNPILNKEILLPDLLHMENENKKKMTTWFKAIIDSYQHQQLYWELDTKILLLNIIKEMLNMAHSDSNLGISSTIQNISDYIKAYVEHNYYKKITLSLLSNQMGYHEDYLSKRFKLETEKNFNQYLNEVRIDHAKKLLTNTTQPISYIAELVGYQDVYYFSRVFKKNMNISPNEYRKAIFPRK